DRHGADRVPRGWCLAAPLPTGVQGCVRRETLDLVAGSVDRRAAGHDAVIGERRRRIHIEVTSDVRVVARSYADAERTETGFAIKTVRSKLPVLIEQDCSNGGPALHRTAKPVGHPRDL